MQKSLSDSGDFQKKKLLGNSSVESLKTLMYNKVISNEMRGALKVIPLQASEKSFISMS